MSLRDLLRGRPPSPDAPPPTLPSDEEALAVEYNDMSLFLDDLRIPSEYRITHPGTRRALKLVLYAFAINSSSPFARHFSGSDQSSDAIRPDEVNDAFNLRTVQKKRFPHGKAASKSRACAHIFKTGESVYRCRDCAVDSTCVLCSRCYHASIHASERHDVTMAVHGGLGTGCCDCGDPEAFKDGKAWCRHHPADDNAGEPQPEAPELVELKEYVAELVAYIVDTTIRDLSNAPDKLVAPKQASDIRDPRRLPPGFVPPDSDREPGSSHAVGAEDTPVPAASNDDPLTPTEGREYTPLERLMLEVGHAPAALGPWSVVLWNDEKHSFAEVIEQVSRATGMSRREAGDVAQRVDTHGRDVIYTSTNVTRLLSVSRLISAIGLTVTVRPSWTTFEEEVAGEMLEFIKDLALCRVDGQDGALAETIAKVLLDKAEHEPYNKEQKPLFTRFQQLLDTDKKLWKGLRQSLSELYVALIGVSLDVKTEIAVQFAGMYQIIADRYLLSDREPEHSIIYLGVQLFTVPSISARLVAQGQLLIAMLAVLFAFFTEQIDPERRTLLLPPPRGGPRVNPESPAFKQKRYFQIFSDIGHLIAAAQAQEVICRDPDQLEGIMMTVNLFTGMDKHTRAVGTHIEYESDTWVSAFNVTIQVGRLCRGGGEAFKTARSPSMVHEAAHRVIQFHDARHGADEEWLLSQQAPFTFAGTKYTVATRRVERLPMSFHHPLQWLLAEILKYAQPDEDSAFVQKLSPTALRKVADESLSVVCLVSQIRAGLWVRNGFAMRAQQLHYKEYSLRENTYDQDIYLLQFTLAFGGADEMIATIVERYHLAAWLEGADSHPAYDPSQCVAMAEELLSLFIVLLSEPSNICRWTAEQDLRREIIHYLALGPSTFSDLARRISEQYSDNPAMDRILEEVATFRQPVSTSDQGTYTLRKPFYKEVNPYFARYSRNQREEAERAAKQAIAPNDDHYVMIPSTLDTSKGPIRSFMRLAGNQLLLSVVAAAMVRAVTAKEIVSEQLLDHALQLVMIGLVEQPTAVSAHLVQPLDWAPFGGRKSAEVMAALAHDDRIPNLRAKIVWCLRSVEALQGQTFLADLVSTDSKDAAMAEQAIDEKEAKRRAAKARQEAIMKQFAQAQKTFLEDNEDVDAEDDDEAMHDGTTSFGSCITCQGDLDGSQPFGTLGLIQASQFIRRQEDHVDSSVLLRNPTSQDASMSHMRPFGMRRFVPDDEALSGEDGEEDGLRVPQPFIPQRGLHISGCGHYMHSSCFETYTQSTELRHSAQPTRCHAEDSERSEFICPLCKSLGNVLFPVSAPDAGFGRHATTFSQEPLATYVSDPRSPDSTSVLHDYEGNFSFLRPISQWRKALKDVDPVGNALTGLVIGSALVKEASREGEQDYSLVELLEYTLTCLEVASRGTDDQAGEVPETAKAVVGSLLNIARHLAGPTPDVLCRSVVHYMMSSMRVDNNKQDRLFNRLLLVAIGEPESVKRVAAFGFYTTVFQVLGRCFVDASKVDPSAECDTGEAEDEIAALDLLGRYCPADIKLRPGVLGKLIYNHALVYLRRVVTLVSILGETIDTSMEDGCELSRLSRALGIPPPSVVLPEGQPATTNDTRDILTMRQHVEELELAFDRPGGHASRLEQYVLDAVPFDLGARLEWPAVYELVGLPSRLDTLIAESMRLVCPNCGQVPSEPAICLVCCRTLCNQTFCCMADEDEGHLGECNQHMLWECTGTVGLFYLIKKNSILYLYTDRGCFSNPPYLDSHGEVDSGHRRIRHQFPQHLHQSRYDEVRKAWMTHSIPTVVARKLEATTDYGGWATM